MVEFTSRVGMTFVATCPKCKCKDANITVIQQDMIGVDDILKCEECNSKFFKSKLYGDWEV